MEYPEKENNGCCGLFFVGLVLLVIALIGMNADIILKTIFKIVFHG